MTNKLKTTPGTFRKEPRIRVTIDCSNDPGITRQEDRLNTDINHIMKRFGVTGELPHLRTPGSGEVDYTVSLQDALHTLSDARAAIATLPEDVRAQYPSWDHVVAAVRNGELPRVLKERADRLAQEELDRTTRKELEAEKRRLDAKREQAANAAAERVRRGEAPPEPPNE